MTEPEGRIRVRSYEVSIWPDELADDINADIWCLTVAYRGAGRWGVFRSSGNGGPCLGRDGTWAFGSPDEADRAAWLANYRFTEQEALDLARERAPGLRLNGYTAAEVLAEVLDNAATRHEGRRR